ncbi:MAG: hypothetical protein ACFFAA_09815 [Promethearchaeota archaeon]
MTKIFLILWIITILYGIITLILSIVNLNIGFVWLIYFSNILSLIPYALMFFPTLQIFIILSDIIKDKKFEGNSKIIKAFSTQFLIAIITSLLIVLIFGGSNLTTNVLFEFFAVFSLWIFFISIIVFLIYVLYAYFGEV